MLKLAYQKQQTLCCFIVYMELKASEFLDPELSRFLTRTLCWLSCSCSCSCSRILEDGNAYYGTSQEINRLQEHRQSCIVREWTGNFQDLMYIYIYTGTSLYTCTTGRDKEGSREFRGSLSGDSGATLPITESQYCQRHG
jgi:hypothetical protein